MQIQKVNSNQKNQNFGGLLKLGSNIVLIPKEIVSGVHNRRMIYQPFGKHPMEVEFDSVDQSLLEAIARAKSELTDTVEDVSARINQIRAVDTGTGTGRGRGRSRSSGEMAG